MKEYVYPDTEDQITSRLVERHGSSNWEQQEKWVLEEVLVKISDQNRKRTGVMMDLGCGMGRLTEFYEHLFEKIICIDPDSTRLDIAQKHLTSDKRRTIDFFKGFAPKIAVKQKADFILCSHVIQHVPTYQLLPFFEWMNEHLNPKGSILLLFAKSTSYQSEFSVGYSEGGGRSLNEKEFNEVFDNEGSLPVHKIPPLMVEEISRESSLELVWECAFHLRSKIPLNEIDSILRFIEQSNISREIGIDHAMLLAKAEGQ